MNTYRFPLLLLLAVAPALPGFSQQPPEVTNSLGMPFVRIPAGKFMMGTPPGEWGRCSNEGPIREVTLTRAFYLCRYETVNQWFEQFLAETKYDPKPHNESDFQLALYLKEGKERDELKPLQPIRFVSWYAALRFCNWLSEKEGRPPVYVFPENEKEGEIGLPVVRLHQPEAGGYRLPTEAEWEYAARAGTTTAFFFGKDDTGIFDYAYLDKAYYAPMEPREIPTKKRANPWGLFHMVGNVGEWCWDRYAQNYDFAPTVDPRGPERGLERVVRDGSGMGRFGLAAAYGRSGSRLPEFPTVTRYGTGFRVAYTDPVGQ